MDKARSIISNCKESASNFKETSAEHLNTFQFKSRLFYRKFKSSKKLKLIAAGVGSIFLILIVVIIVLAVGRNRVAPSDAPSDAQVAIPSDNNSDEKPNDAEFGPGDTPAVQESIVQLDTTAATPPPSNGKKAIVYSRCVQPGMISLTFDDGPSPNLPNILKVLNEFKVKATFFVNADYLADFRSTTSRAAIDLQNLFKQGHQIGGHTMTHLDLTRVTRQQRWDEMRRNDEYIKSAIGVRPLHFRAPYMRYSDAMLLDLGSWGYTVSGVSLNTMDDTFNNNNVVTGVSNIVDPIINAADSTKISFIAMNHDFKVGTADWLQKFIPQAQGKGFKFVTSQECLGVPAYR